MENKSKKEILAFKALKKGNHLEAEILLREIISSGTNNYSVYGSLAILSGKKGNINEMLEYLIHSTKLNPNYAEGHFNLGIIYLKKEDFNNAANSFFKTRTSADRTQARTLLHENIPITGTLLSGTYNTDSAGREKNVKVFSHGMFQSVYDYPFASSSANHIFDIQF